LTVVLSSPVPELVEEVAHRIVILRDGAVLACDTVDGLRRLAGCDGSLGDVLEQLLYPETTRHLERYFEEARP
jgi:ABC-type multidrug transport system ATPase subunit